MTLTQTCSVAEIFDDPAAPALCAEYERECANLLLSRTAPQREAYENLEQLGVAQCFSVRLHGTLCGFAVVLMGVLPHYGRSYATVESLFVAAAARTGGAGTQLMQAVEAFARGAQCEAIFYSAPVGSRLEKLLSVSGDEYWATNLVFTKRLI